MRPKLILIACLIAVPLMQGCVVNRIMDSEDRKRYSEYLTQTQQNNLEREKAGLQPDKPLAFDEWRGKK